MKFVGFVVAFVVCRQPFDFVFEKIDPENKILVLNSDFGIDDDED